MKSKNLEKNQNKAELDIKNTIENSTVFVGNKRKNITEKKAILIDQNEMITPKYRAITMPSFDETPKFQTTKDFFNNTTNQFKRRMKTLQSYQGRRTMYEASKSKSRQKSSGKSINAYIHNLSAYLKQSKKIVNR